MASSAKSQPSSLTVQLTQNTAPVFEFRCLWTRGVNKKRKTFRDGFVRYHTFNKRIMLYDDGKNSIGGGHWSGAEAIQEGCEFELDKGFIVEVGEPTGITETDLSGLLDRKKEAAARNVRTINRGSPESPISPKPTYFAPTARSVGSDALLAPKTLNSILGAPRGLYGRALLQPKSPYEKRQFIESRYQNENRPAKRQKLDTKNIHAIEATPRTGVNRAGTVNLNVAQPPTLAQQAPPIARTANARPAQEYPPRPLLSKDYTPGPQFSKNAAVNTSNALSDYETERHSAKSRKSVKSDSQSKPASLNTDMEGKVSRRATKASRAASEREEQSEVTNALRFASNKPRRKLMYRDLLPQGEGSSSSPPKGRQHLLTGADLVHEQQHKEPSEPGELLEVRQKTQSKSRTRKKSPLCELSSSPAFETLEDVQDPFADFNQFDLDRCDLDLDDQTKIFNAEESASLIPESPIRTPQKCLVKRRISPTPAAKTLELSQLDQILLRSRPTPLRSPNHDSPGVRKPTPCTSSSPGHKPPFSLSTAVSIPKTVAQTRVDAANKQPSPPAGRPSLLQLQPHPQPRRPSPKEPLQKSLSDQRPQVQPPTLKTTVSDITGLQKAKSAPSKENQTTPPKPVEKSKDEDLGPWSREAFDLFGW